MEYLSTARDQFSCDTCKADPNSPCTGPKANRESYHCPKSDITLSAVALKQLFYLNLLKDPDIELSARALEASEKIADVEGRSQVFDHVGKTLYALTRYAEILTNFNGSLAEHKVLANTLLDVADGILIGALPEQLEDEDIGRMYANICELAGINSRAPIHHQLIDTPPIGKYSNPRRKYIHEFLIPDLAVDDPQENTFDDTEELGYPDPAPLQDIEIGVPPLPVKQLKDIEHIYGPEPHIKGGGWFGL